MWLPTRVLVLCGAGIAAACLGNAATIEVEVTRTGRTSLGVFDAATGNLVRTLKSGERLPVGKHSVNWDGLDDRGKPLPPGKYEWRSVTAPGLVARYVTAIGINPPGGEHPVPSKSWVGDHTGPGTVDVDASGVYVGAAMTENLLSLLKADSAMSTVLWRRPQFYDGGQLRRVATGGSHAFMLDPFGKLRKLNAASGKVEAEWSLRWDDAVPNDLAACGKNLVLAYPAKNAVRWVSIENGNVLVTTELREATCVAALGGEEKGAAVASAGRELFRVEADKQPQKIGTLPGKVDAISIDPVDRAVWVLVDGHRVLRFDGQMRLEQTYGATPRSEGPFDAARFSGATDLAADLSGGFFVAEPHSGARRLVHISREGKVLGQWFGGMSFYAGGTFDPDDATLLYGFAREGSINVIRIDYERGTWKIEASYDMGGLGDSLFPHAAAYRAIRRDGQLNFYHRAIPSVLRIDAEKRKVIPVAIAGRVLNAGRTFFQFAGTGREGYPKPWVAAAEHHGYTELSKAPPYFSWADSNGDGAFDPAEFVFYAEAKRGLSFHNPGDFTATGDYLGTSDVNEPQAMLRLPITAWEGPNKAAPRWDWNKLQPVGEVTVDQLGWGTSRSVTITPNGEALVPFHAGLLVREHGQYEGGNWPEQQIKQSRILAFDASFRSRFAAGRQSKDPKEASTGALYYPVQAMPGPNESVVVNDQTIQPAQVWTHDGLYVGGMFDGRIDDGLDADFYRVHGDDNQGGAVVTHAGKTYWLMPYIGHNRLYEITGWQDWRRQSASLSTR